MSLTLGKTAKQVGMSEHTIRYYIKLGLIFPQRNPDNHYYLFCDKDIEKLHFIKKAKFLNFTLQQIKEILIDAESGKSTCPKVRAYLKNHIAQNKAKIAELQTLQNRMEETYLLWEKQENGMPSSGSVCKLIESISMI